MRHATRAAIAVLLGVAVAMAGSAAARERAVPALRVESFQPFSVHGMRFAPSEYVRVTLNTVYTRRVKASAGGTFTVDFGLPVDRCSGLLVTAVGSKGSRVDLRTRPLACPSVNPD